MDSRSEPGQWRATEALRRGMLIAALALLAAAAMGRPDLVVLAAPLTIGLVTSLAVRPRRAPSAELIVDDDRVGETEELQARVRVTNPDATPVIGVINVAAGGWLRLRYGFGLYVDQLPSKATTSVSLRGKAQRWGHYAIGPVTVHAIACDGLLRSREQRLASRPVIVHPTADLFDSGRPLPNAAGMTGIHRSRRHGEGGELAEVRPFQPGDRLRRIDWRVTLRNRVPFVNATLSERDAEVVILADVLHDGRDDEGPGIVDVTVRAAAALTEHYVQQGDRVSIVEFGPGMRRLRPGTGRRHFLAALEWLSDTRVLPSDYVASDRLVSAGYLPFGSIVIMLTPLLDERSTEALARLIRSGRTLMAVDTLPDGLRPVQRTQWTSTAHGLWKLNRQNTIGRLRELGVPVSKWQGPGSLDLMLTDLTRISRAPKVGAR